MVKDKKYLKTGLRSNLAARLKSYEAGGPSTRSVGVRLDHSAYERVRQLATKEGISVSFYLARLIIKHLP